jgi:hypothetical protein
LESLYVLWIHLYAVWIFTIVVLYLLSFFIPIITHLFHHRYSFWNV